MTSTLRSVILRYMNTTAVAPKSTTSQQVEAFVTACSEAGFSWFITGNSVGVTTSFAPGDSKAFVAADGDGPYLVSLVPTTRSGSVYGTDGGSVGGFAAINSGRYSLRTTGASKRFAAALAKAAR